MFSSSPPPMDDAPDEEDEEFGDFGTFSVGGVPNSVSFSEFETPTTFNQTQALNATSPPSLNHSRGLICCPTEGGKANGHVGRPDRSTKDGSHTETLTNGFQGSPTSQNSAPFSQDNDEDFADFAAFSDKAHADSDETLDDDKQSGDSHENNAVKQETANSNRTDPEFANFAAFSKDSEGTLDETQSETLRSQRDDDASQTDHSFPNRTEPEFADFNAFPDDCTLQSNFTGSETAESVSKDEDFVGVAFDTEREKPIEDCSSLNGNALDASGSVCSSDLASESDGGADNLENSKPAVLMNGTTERDKDGGSETETETSFGRPLSTEALEEFGDMSTTGSVPSPPLQEETATPTGDEEEFGDFGDCLSAQEFGNFEQNQPQNTQDHNDEDEEDDFGDFNSSKIKTDDKTEISTSDSFGNFSSVAATDEEPSSVRPPPENTHDPDADEEEEDFGDFGDFNSPKLKQESSDVGFPSSESFGNFSAAAEQETGWSAFGGDDMRTEAEGESWAAFSSEEVTEEPVVMQTTTSRTELLEKLFHSSFPQIQSPSVDDEAPTLQHLLEPDPPQPHSSVCVCVWAQLQDIHEALGLRFQWGGSFCNKALLCSLGIDTRNILFTGQKKQPVIVPMYAAGLGMLEPVKPVSAAEMIASIAHNSPCSSESVQEALPPVQFDWSSSGLTNPLDGVDPELFELTTAKLDPSNVTDAFAKLMSTVHTTSTSTARRPRREENLSDEALKVISRFPDLSFMTAKVLMFPTTLTPHGAEPESGPSLENKAD